ncbi:MAG: hypothetical protein EZS28_055806, partial [Streblomastix strix]
NPFIDKSPLDKADESQTPILGQEYDKRRNYLNNDGAVLMVTGHYGQLSTTIFPLSIILDFPPMRPKLRRQFSTAQFFFPSIVSSMKLCPQPLKLAEDEGIVYLYGNRASTLTWNDRNCKIIVTDLEYTGIIHSLVSLRVVDEQPTLLFQPDDDTSEQSFQSRFSPSFHNCIRDTSVCCAT